MIWIFFALATIDVICTGIGMKLGLCEELNPLAAWMFRWSILGTCLIFGVFNGLLCAFFAWAMDKVKWLRDAVLILMGGRLLIIYLHAYWIISVLRRK